MPLPSPEVLARRLLGRAPDRIEPLVVWDHRATFRCSIGADDFVCKADENLDEIRRETEGLRRAIATGISVPELVAAEPGALAMRWVRGAALARGSPPAWWRVAGRELRKIHEVATNGSFGGGFAPARDSWAAAVEAEVDEELDKCVRRCGLDADQAGRIRRAVRGARAELASVPASWCHGDLQPDHVIIDRRADRVAGIIDWSDQGKGDAGWDIAVLTLDEQSPLDALLRGL